MARALNYRLAKIHRNYAVEEAATLFGVHRNTVREWVRRGLPVVQGRPMLVLGRDLREFIRHRREHAKRRCGPEQIYCLRCREPRAPADGMVEYQAIVPNRGRFIALCSQCGAVMYRSANPAKLPRPLALMAGLLPVAS